MEEEGARENLWQLVAKSKLTTSRDWLSNAGVVAAGLWDDAWACVFNRKLSAKPFRKYVRGSPGDPPRDRAPLLAKKNMDNTGGQKRPA